MTMMREVMMAAMASIALLAPMIAVTLRMMTATMLLVMEMQAIKVLETIDEHVGVAMVMQTTAKIPTMMLAPAKMATDMLAMTIVILCLR